MTLIHLAHSQKNEWRKHYERKSNRAKINADGKKDVVVIKIDKNGKIDNGAN